MITSVLIGLALILFLSGILLVISGLKPSEDSIEPIAYVSLVQPLPVAEPKPSIDPHAVEDLKLKLQEKENQLAHSQKSLEEMNREREKLQVQVEQDRENLGQLNDNILQLRSGMELATTKEHAKLHALEDEVQRLYDDNQKLLSGKNFASKLKVENEQLQKDIQGSNQKIQELLKGLETLQSANEGKLSQMQKQVEELQRQERAYMSQLESQRNNPELEKTREKITELNQETERLLSENAGMMMNIAKLREFNTHLLEKEKMLQYELTKSRAQTIGLEKVCQDFKIQIDQLSKFKQAVHES